MDDYFDEIVQNDQNTFNQDFNQDNMYQDQNQQEQNNYEMLGHDEQQEQMEEPQQNKLQGLYAMEVDPKKQERMQRYQQSEDRINELVNEKMMKEGTRKQELKAQALIDLQEWSNKQSATFQSKRDTNREKQQSLLNSQQVGEKGNKWEVVVDNIEMKESQYPGTKDVTRMREAIQGRLKDIHAQE